MDLGDCPKIHDLALRADYETASRQKDYYFDIDAMEHLQSFVADCDRRTEQAARRLKETQAELSEEANQKAEIIHQLGEQIGTKLAKAEQFGAEGHVEESLKYMEEVDDLKKKKGQAEIEFRNSMPASSYQQQKLRVCEICSAYLGIHDNDRRLADHFGGKLHLGFIKIREKLEELKVQFKSVAERRKQRETEREIRRKEREEEDLKREQEREERRAKRRDRSRSRSRDRSRRSRSGSRHRRRRRSRSRSGSRYSSSRRRSRSRSRDRRSRSKRSRSRSKHRRRTRSRSRSRSHYKSKSRSPEQAAQSREASVEQPS